MLDAAGIGYVSIHARVERATHIKRYVTQWRTVSIHARVERATQCFFSLKPGDWFQSTHA